MEPIPQTVNELMCQLQGPLTNMVSLIAGPGDLSEILDIILDVIFKQILVIDGWGISCEIALIWMSLDFIYDQLTLVQVMAWCWQSMLTQISLAIWCH